MSGKQQAKDIIVKLIVGAGNASPSPPVGPALGSKGVKSMDFCKEFNGRTAHLVAGTPMPTRVTIRPDRSFHFEIRTPATSWLLLQAAGIKEVKGKLKGANMPFTSKPVADKSSTIGTVSLKHVYEIAKIKKTEPRLSGLSLEGITKSIVAQARTIGLNVVP